MLIKPDDVAEMFGSEVAAHLTYRADSAAIIKWHNMGEHLEKIIDSQHFFALIGVRLTVVDIAAVRDNEILQDLNMPLRPELVGRFDIVIDPGTLEHCFNVGQGIQNMLSMAKIGGFVFHINPHGNHGFYNFCPTFYFDFYNDNGHELVSKIVAEHGTPFDYRMTELPLVGRYRLDTVPPESTILVVVRKLHDTPPKWPVQTKYKSGLARA